MKSTFEELLELFRANGYFFYSFGLFLILAGVLLTQLEVGDAVFFFSDHRTTYGNWFFTYVTEMGEGLFFILGIIALLFVRYRYAVMLPVLGAAVTLVTYSLKTFFGHPRPYPYFRDLDLLDLFIPVEGVAMNQGWNSFPSGHTMAAFALYTFLALTLPRKKIGGLVFFFIAAAVALSRIYLAQHFLKDIFFGSILGVLLAVTFYLLSRRLPGHWTWTDRSLLKSFEEEQVEA